MYQAVQVLGPQTLHYVHHTAKLFMPGTFHLHLVHHAAKLFMQGTLHMHLVHHAAKRFMPCSLFPVPVRTIIGSRFQAKPAMLLISTDALFLLQWGYLLMSIPMRTSLLIAHSSCILLSCSFLAAFSFLCAGTMSRLMRPKWNVLLLAGEAHVADVICSFFWCCLSWCTCVVHVVSCCTNAGNASTLPFVNCLFG